ncbi:pentapeptide repeat-containing protein [Nonomuraea sp. C10]|uniref:pentapeptide repeat-containing protein n=1 Tax=Nonomuraea sp. C10 TaxID=2600577 RepID=UPI0011CD4E2B|nr:pentapeptide repeat-containing protein [Nonomuraea sp. C10]TXK41712.1 pentapeptide repeat-containing protein [Nonomuraea sp. C10]
MFTLILLGFPQLEVSRGLPLAIFFDVMKLSFAVIAGVGGVVALVVAYRRQLVAEATSKLEHAKEERERDRVLNERFGSAATQIGSDQPTVQLAGVYAMAALADDWPEQRQTCINVLCGFLRMPYQPAPGPDGPVAERTAFAQHRNVRHTVIGIICDHLNPGAQGPLWHDCHFDLSGAVFDGGNFSWAVVPEGCSLNFLGAKFVAGTTDFYRLRCHGGVANFWGVEFLGGEVRFWGAEFLSGGFGECTFSGGKVDFGSKQMGGGELWTTVFAATDTRFLRSKFTGAEVLFTGVAIRSGRISFDGAEFSGGKVDFAGVRIEEGAELDFSNASVWTTPPAHLPTSAPQVKLPRSSGSQG